MIVVFGSLTVDLITPVAHLPRMGETVIGGDTTIVKNFDSRRTSFDVRPAPVPAYAKAAHNTSGVSRSAAETAPHLRTVCARLKGAAPAALFSARW